LCGIRIPIKSHNLKKNKKGGKTAMNINEFNDIVYEKDEETGIVTLTMNTPKRKNAMSPVTLLEVFWAFDIMEKDNTAGAMIITGAKDPDLNEPEREAFSSGGYFDIAALQSISEEIKSQIDLTDIAQKKLTLKMWRQEKPVIAAINGLAIGGGFTLPLAGADYIFMSEHAWISLPFVRLGIMPEFASTFLLPRIIGFQKAKEIMYSGERITARQAFDLGLVNKVLPHDELLPYARQEALRLIPPKSPGLALKLTKKALHKQLLEELSEALDRENEGLNRCFKSADFFEAIQARKEKREPVFKGA
jgi:2-(1,2-epoxy-1,2-dihydrophenyl)acetyl-CoA isomerase